MQLIANQLLPTSLWHWRLSRDGVACSTLAPGGRIDRCDMRLPKFLSLFCLAALVFRSAALPGDWAAESPDQVRSVNEVSSLDRRERGCVALWVHPVNATIAEAFHPPTSRYGPGNRGLEYSTVGGEDVVAVEAGTVTFAGNVGVDRFVVVDHEGGVRSTYAYLQSIAVARNQSVERGETLATAGPSFHLTARTKSDDLAESVYVDPMLYLYSGSTTDIDGPSSCLGVARLVSVPSGFEVVITNQG